MSLISSMRNKKLKKYNEFNDDEKPLTEHIKDFILQKGEIFILPYLDVYDRDRFGSGNK